MSRRPLSGASALALADTFKVLGDTTRIRILDALSRSELCVCDLAWRENGNHAHSGCNKSYVGHVRHPQT